jgi:signal transduction histidine kinase
MSTSASWPPFLPRWLGYIGIWVLLMIVCAPQLYWDVPNQTWSSVFWKEFVYWSSWGVVSLPVFWLCRRLYEGPRTWKRYVVGLLLGALGASLLQPLIDETIVFTRSLVEWLCSIQRHAPDGFLSGLVAAAKRHSGSNPIIFGAVALAWYALRYSRDLREKQLKSAELETRLREARLEALRSQLNPHFLFNTLHSIAELVHEDPGLAEQLVLRLADLLRKVLVSTNQHELALAEEIEFIKGYLDIEQMRLGSRLRIEWSIDPQVLNVPVPSLLLQPLVENAVQHGVGSASGAGTVQIQARRENGFLLLQVRDTGPGLEHGSRAANTGIGLANTRARLQTIFGDRHGFELVSDHGLAVNVRLPIPVANSGPEARGVSP